MEEVKRKRGRPVKNTPLNNQFRVMLSDTDMVNLRLLSVRSGQSKSEIIRGLLTNAARDNGLNTGVEPYDDIFEAGFGEYFGEVTDDF